jgi:hypothetical protein
MDGIDLISVDQNQDKWRGLVKPAMGIHFAENKKCMTRSGTISFWRITLLRGKAGRQAGRQAGKAGREAIDIYLVTQ